MSVKMREGQGTDSGELRITYELFIALMCWIAFLVMASYYLLPLPQTVKEVLYIADVLICIPLLLDFFVRLQRAPDRKRYLVRSGWLDLLGSLPSLPLLRTLRLISVQRTIRRLRAGTSEELMQIARRRLAESTLLVTGLVIYLVLVAGSSAVVVVESRSPEANIVTGQEAVWWAFVTVATVGYGDYYPVTSAGRVLAVLMMLTGITLLGVLTSYLASSFLNRRGLAEESKLAALQAELSEVKALLRAQQPPAAAQPNPERDEPPA
jgi:voltage-gated potassium channel